MAEGLIPAVSGLGVLGDAEPGWSEQEFATPVNPNERAGGTGVVSFSANDVAAGILSINKDATSTYAPLGSVAGVVRSSSKTGQRISVSHDNKLARYNATRNIPPMVAASVPGALDLAEQVLGTTRLNKSSGAFWSLAGHLAAFDGNGDRVNPVSQVRDYGYFNPATSLFVNETIVSADFDVNASAFTFLNNNIYATAITGDRFYWEDNAQIGGSITWPSNKLKVQGKTFLNGQDFTFQMLSIPNQGGVNDYERRVYAEIDYSAETITIRSDYVDSGIYFPGSSQTLSIATLDRDAEIAFRVYYTRSGDSSTALASRLQKVAFEVCNTSDFTTRVGVVINPSYTDVFPVYFEPWEISGNVRALWYRRDSGDFTDQYLWSSDDPTDWETPVNFAFTGTPSIGEASIGFGGSVWDWLQDACTAYRWEIGLENDVITARPIGQIELDVSNYAAIPTVTPTTTRTGRQVDIVYQNASIVSGGEVYDAREDDNRIISVGAAQETVTKITTNAYLTAVFQPTRVTTFVPGEGTYYVIDSTGLPIVEGQWEDYGGALSVAIDSAEAGTITVTLTGPREEIPSTTAPYSLAVSDGVNQYAALSILGSGVLADPQTLNLLTGANPDITPQQVAFTVTNPFISTAEQAYDAGIWASVDASGPRVELTISVPTSSLTGFGVTAGSLINIQDSTYRVVSANVGRTQTSITAVRHATVSAFDDAWSGETVADHDAAWDGYLAEDQKVLPYLGSPAATLPPPIFPP